MVDWVETYKNSTKQFPTVRTNVTWWDECTKYDDTAFFDAELGVIDWKDNHIDGMSLPYGTSWTYWQNHPFYKHGGSSDMFHGSISSLESMAAGV